MPASRALGCPGPDLAACRPALRGPAPASSARVNARRVSQTFRGACLAGGLVSPHRGPLMSDAPLYRWRPCHERREHIVTEEFHRHSAWESSHSPIKSTKILSARGRMPVANAHIRPEAHDNRLKLSDRSHPGRPMRRGSGHHQGTARMSGIRDTSSYGATEITEFRYA